MILGGVVAGCFISDTGGSATWGEKGPEGGVYLGEWAPVADGEGGEGARALQAHRDTHHLIIIFSDSLDIPI